MSIAAALSNAVSGLAATARGTEIVSVNVANAMTPGYGRRELMVSSSPVAGGVHLDGIMRAVNASVLGDRRAAEAGCGGSLALARFWTAIEGTIGLAGDGNSLPDRVSGLEAALTSAASRPDSDVRLAAVARAASDLAGVLNALGTAIADARTQAEVAIGDDVARLNGALAEVATLNRAVIVEQSNGRDPSALMDARQKAIDAVAAIVPLREVPRENGRVALFTASGAALLDGPEPVTIAFRPVGRIQPGMTVGTPPVGRLIFGGQELSARQMRLVAGGSLDAQFRIRDEIAPQMQSRADAFARDLYQRFADPALDASLTTGQPGLFTDAGGAFLTANEAGLANRIAIARAVDPDIGGEAWRLRDGLNAAAPGEVGRAALLTAMAQALQDARITASPSAEPGMRTSAGFAAELSSHASTRRLSADAGRVHADVRRDSLTEELMRDGVDTDREMERLLQLENAYAANAKVIAAVDAMLATMLEI